MARRFSIEDWQHRLNSLGQPVIITGKRKEDKKEIFTIQCCKCGNTFDADRKSLYTACYSRECGKISSDWCPICNRKRNNEGVNDVATLKKDLVKYFVNPKDAKRYSISSHARVNLKCLECGQERKVEVADFCARGFYCPYCSDKISLGNKIIRNLIAQLPVEKYVVEFSDSWTQKKIYDCFFLFKNKKYLIEIDGRQHIRSTNWCTREEQQSNDALKTRLAKENGYILIRINAYKSDFEYIKDNIIKSYLSELFDFNFVDWDAIYERTITSTNIEMAKYYMEHNDMMMKDIANHFHVSQSTLRKALKKLTNIGLCNYSKEKAYENAKPHIKRIKAMNRKAV